MRRAQNTADALSFLFNKLAIAKKNIAAKLSVMLLCHIKDLLVRHKAELVCCNLITITRVAGDIYSSRRRNFGSCWLVLKTLY